MMALATGFATLGCAYSIWSRIGVPGLVAAAGFVLLAVLFRFRRKGGTT